MSLRSDVDGALPRFRAEAESLMTDTCQIGSFSSDEVLNPETGEYEHVFTPVYDGPCRFKAGNVQASDVESASQLLVSQLATPPCRSIRLRMCGTACRCG